MIELSKAELLKSHAEPEVRQLADSFLFLMTDNIARLVVKCQEMAGILADDMDAIKTGTEDEAKVKKLIGCSGKDFDHVMQVMLKYSTIIEMGESGRKYLYPDGKLATKESEGFVHKVK